MSRLGSVLFWSVIAAAFIGPGTVATAASAGAAHRYALLWALVFSSLACLLLQESSARITIVSGLNLGQALRRRYRGGAAGVAVLLLVLGAIVLGCAAYETGNILGGVAGARLGFAASPALLTLACGLIAGGLLWFGAPRTVAKLLGLFVAVMGVAFLVTAWNVGPDLAGLARGALIPRFPSGSGLLVLGLIGTTVVPYNLFLGSGLARGRTLGETRFGLAVAVSLGGLISMGIVVVGSTVDGPFSFEALAEVLRTGLGAWARHLFAMGLFAAGLSSAITAPLAAAVTAQSLLARGEGHPEAAWSSRGWKFRAAWLGVLGIGVGFSLIGLRPVPAILLAQALNGLLLPLVALFLLLAVNDRRLMGDAGLNGPLANASLGVVVAATVVLGLTGLTKALAGALNLPPPGEGPLLTVAGAVALLVAVPLWREAARRRAPLETKAAGHRDG